MQRNDLTGVECDWLASDRDGHVAVIASVGYGPIPQPVMDSAGAGKDFDIAAFAEGLVPRSALTLDNPYAGNCSEYVALGERGVFVYDWSVHRGPYKRSVAPERPIHLSDVPSSFRQSVIVVNGVCFVDAESFHPDLMSERLLRDPESAI
jgi:hypothetical protein